MLTHFKNVAYTLTQTDSHKTTHTNIYTQAQTDRDRERLTNTGQNSLDTTSRVLLLS